jgi:hypothetical protein
MSRHLTIKVDCEDQHCHIGSKQKCRYLIHDTDTSICRLFTRSLKTDELGTVLRCDACLKAEHTDDTPRDERDLQS